MKTLMIAAAVLATALMTTPTPLRAAEGQAHAHGKVAGPNGGRVLETATGHAEFLVQPDRKVRITFLNDALKPVPAAQQTVKATAEAKSGKATLEFVRSGDILVSKTALPDGDGYRIVLQIRPDPSAKPENLRIDFISATCPGCKLAEYACTCEH